MLDLKLIFKVVEKQDNIVIATLKHHLLFVLYSFFLKKSVKKKLLKKLQNNEDIKKNGINRPSVES